MAGAFQDNREIPYEGIVVTEMDKTQQDLLLRIVQSFFVIQPEASAQARLAHIREYLSETYFSWIGGHGLDDPFYYRIQSPVVLLEFDHHSGVFLTNDQPAKFHIHTIQRLPNGNDYGRELIKLWKSKQTGA